MEGSEEPPEKKRRSVQLERCAICTKRLVPESKDNPVVKKPTVPGLKSILDAAEKRRDDVFVRLSPM